MSVRPFKGGCTGVAAEVERWMYLHRYNRMPNLYCTESSEYSTFTPINSTVQGLCKNENFLGDRNLEKWWMS